MSVEILRVGARSQVSGQIQMMYPEDISSTWHFVNKMKLSTGGYYSDQISVCHFYNPTWGRDIYLTQEMMVKLAKGEMITLGLQYWA